MLTFELKEDKIEMFSSLIEKADEAFAQFDASGDDELDYKVVLLAFIFQIFRLIIKLQT